MSYEPTSLKGKLILVAGVALFAISQSLLFIVVAPLVRATGLTEIQFGLVFSVANIPLIILAPIWGRKSDELGRRPIFLTGLIGSAVGTIMIALTLQGKISGWYDSTLMLAILLGLSRATYTCLASAVYPSSSGYMADVTARADRAQGMALIGGANSLGSIVGPALGLLGGFGFLLLPMYAAVAITVAGVIWAYFNLEEPEKHAKPANAAKLKFTDSRLRPFMIMWASFFIIFIALNFVTAFYIEDKFNVTETGEVMQIAGIALVSMALVIVIVQGYVMQVLIKPSPKTMLLCCGPVYVIGLLTIGLAPTLAVLYLGYGIIGIAFSFATPGINGTASLMVEPHEQGAAAGILAASNTVGAILGPTVGPLLYRVVGPSAPMLIGAALFSILSVYILTVDIDHD